MGRNRAVMAASTRLKPSDNKKAIKIVSKMDARKSRSKPTKEPRGPALVLVSVNKLPVSNTVAVSGSDAGLWRCLGN
jgi:hypothetical protein